MIARGKRVARHPWITVTIDTEPAKRATETNVVRDRGRLKVAQHFSAGNMGNNKREPAKRATDTEPPASFLSLWERREVRVRSIASGIRKPCRRKTYARSREDALYPAHYCSRFRNNSPTLPHLVHASCLSLPHHVLPKMASFASASSSSRR